MNSLLYKKSGLPAENCGGEWEVHKFSPGLFKLHILGENKKLKSTLARLYFYLMAGKKCVIYYVLSSDGEPIHTSTVMPKCFKFRYLKENECEIGPCYTRKEFRGRGIYPCVLKHILSDYDAETYYMTVHKNNVSSIRGIEKAGFLHCGYIRKSGIFKIYRLAQEEK